MKKYEHAFGKNDIRGIYGDDITEELFFHIGRAFVKWLELQSGKGVMYITVTIDARMHSPSLRDALNEGITSTGAHVINLGLAPTPIGYYSEVVMDDVIAAAIITASHNPKEYNGLKLTYNKTTLDEEQIAEVKGLVGALWSDNSFFIRSSNGIQKELSDQSFYDIFTDYIAEMKAQFDNIGKGIKVVVDSANATGGVIAPQVYREIGCEVIELFSEPDGTFPNHHPNPSDLKTLEALQKAVVEHKADLGIAFDGDGDRIGVVDAAGCPIPGDMLLLIYALELEVPNPTVVCEVKCSQIVFDTINALGGNAVMSKTGHGYVKAKMRETKAVFGGEMSGHTFFKDRYYGFDDAIYAGCRLIEIVAKHKNANPNFKIQDILKPYDKGFSSSELRYPVPNERKKEVMEKFRALVEADKNLFGSPIKEIITLDGMRILFNNGFALIRQSNTEPVFTLRFEAETKQACERLHNTMINELEKILK